MTDKLRQAAEMALEALNSYKEKSWSVSINGDLVEQAQDALRQTLAEPPVGTKLYAAPPKRDWQGLTDEELPEGATHEFDRGVRWAEAKLKEKNS